MDTSKQPGIQIDQVLLLGAKFAHRADALSLPSNTPIRDLPFQVEAKIAGKAGDPIVAFRLRAFTGDNTETLYTFDVEIAAVISRVVGEENLDPFEYAQDIGPAAFYPFLREAIANITLKGRFGPIWLKPVNLTAAASSAPVEATEAVEA